MRVERLTTRRELPLPPLLLSDPYRKVYYAYLYAYIRHYVREKLNIKDVYHITSSSGRRTPLDTVSRTELYLIVMSSFSAHNVNILTGATMIDMFPTDELINTISTILRIEMNVIFDVILSIREEYTDVAIFVTNETIFLMEERYTLNTEAYYKRWYRFKMCYPHLLRMAIIGITDSTLTIINF